MIKLILGLGVFVSFGISTAQFFLSNWGPAIGYMCIASAIGAVLTVVDK